MGFTTMSMGVREPENTDDGQLPFNEPPVETRRPKTQGNDGGRRMQQPMMGHADDDEVRLDSQGASPLVGQRDTKAYQSHNAAPPVENAYGDEEADTSNPNMVTGPNIFDPQPTSYRAGADQLDTETGEITQDVNGTFPVQSLNAMSGTGSRVSIPRGMPDQGFFSQTNQNMFHKNTQRVQSSDGNWNQGYGRRKNRVHPQMQLQGDGRDPDTTGNSMSLNNLNKTRSEWMLTTKNKKQ